MKTLIRRTALASIATLLVLAGTTAAFAYSQGGGTPQPLSFTIGTPASPAGYVVDLGDQRYSASGGSVILPLTSILGNPLTAATLRFSLSADVRDLQVSGNVQFNLKGTSGGQPITVTGNYNINNAETSTPANAIQNLGSGTCSGRAASACSELPLSFIGQANVQVTIGNAKPQYMTETMMMENPYLNPYGAPIVIASSDFDFVIATTYNVGTILWTGVQVAGPVTGNLGTGTSATPVSGTLTLTSTENENLVAGSATDRGTVALSGMTPSTLNVNGTYTGTSLIPAAGEQDCSPNLGFPSFPAGEGVCTQTGFNSVGKYTMDNSNYNYSPRDYGNKGNNGQVTVTGTYTTTWTIPALAFSTTSSASVTTQQYR